jgi:GNAT superfamily N-acetyltransferase
MSKIILCTKQDFDQILSEIVDFWGSDRTWHLHHPMLVNELGNSAFVIKEGHQVIAYLFGFLSQTEPTGYIHLVGVRRSHQRKGLGQALYAHFTAFAKAHHCTSLKAITGPMNQQSIAFHKKLGFESQLVPDYSGPNKDAIVLRKPI